MSRRMPACFNTGLIHRAVTASPRFVSHPNDSGSRRSSRTRICCMNSPNMVGESFPASTSVLPVSPGGKLPNASHEASTTRPMRSLALPISSWSSATARVDADQRDVVQVEAVEQLFEQPGNCAERDVGVGGNRVAVRADGERRRDAFVAGREIGGDVIP